jgi:hypothetical protein
MPSAPVAQLKCQARGSVSYLFFRIRTFEKVHCASRILQAWNPEANSSGASQALAGKLLFCWGASEQVALLLI